MNPIERSDRWTIAPQTDDLLGSLTARTGEAGGDFIFVRNILLSIKERVEGRPIGSLAAGSAAVSLWFVVFAQFLGSLVMLILRRDWLRPLLAIAATSATTLLLVFLMPPLWVDALAVATITGGLVYAQGLPAPGRRHADSAGPLHVRTG